MLLLFNMMSSTQLSMIGHEGHTTLPPSFLLSSVSQQEVSKWGSVLFPLKNCHPNNVSESFISCQPADGSVLWMGTHLARKNTHRNEVKRVRKWKRKSETDQSDPLMRQLWFPADCISIRLKYLSISHGKSTANPSCFIDGNDG